MESCSDPKKDFRYSPIRRRHSPSVIVIGGGFAGISAARALQNASFKVVVLESRGRIGGRAYTDYSFGFPVDMGAAWLHGACEKNPLAPIIGRLGLPLYRTSGDDSVLFDHDLESYALYDTDGHQIPQELVKYVGGIFESMLKETEKLRQETSNDMSLAKAITKVLERRTDLRLEGLANKVLQWYLCRLEGWFAADAESISLKYWDEVNPSLQHVLPGTLTSQAPVASFQCFQPEDSTCIHAPQVYPLLQRLSAPLASQNIPASSQAPSNVQTGWSSFTPQSAVPDLLVSSQHPTRPQPSKDKVEPKSAVWADTLSRGLVNLNISGPKINPLADIGIDFDDINRKEKRIEVSNSNAPAMSTITMGKAMGTGSGLGRAGPGALAPPINPKMGSNMALGMIRGGMGMGAPGMGIGGGTVAMNMGMGGGGGFSMGMCMGGGGDFGMGMEGYGGNMNQPSVGVGMGMNMGMNTGMGMLPPSGMPQQGHGMPGAYYPMNTGGGYGQQQPYGGVGYR